MTASGVNQSTYCGEYTLLASITDATTKKATYAREGVYLISNNKTAIVVIAISNNKIDK